MKLQYNIILQEVGQTYIAVAVGEDAERFTDVLLLNDIGAFIIEMLKHGKSRDEMLAEMIESYDADADTLSQHLDAFIDSLRQKGVLAD